MIRNTIGCLLYFFLLNAHAFDAARCSSGTAQLRSDAQNAEVLGIAIRNGAGPSAVVEANGWLRKAGASLQEAKLQCGVVDTERDAGIQQIDAWSAAMAKADMHFKDIEPRLLVVVEDVVRRLPPDQWSTALQIIYRALSLPAK